MTAKFMLNTNTVSYLLKGRYPSIRQHIAQYDYSDLCISAITRSELIFGIHNNPQASKVHQSIFLFLTQVQTLDWTPLAADCHGQLRAQLKQQGIGIGTLDLMIAAHAMSLDLILVSNDRAFEYINTLKLQNWLSA